MASAKEARQIRLEQLMPTIRQQLAQGKTARISPGGTSMLPMLRPGTDDVELSPLPPRLKKYDLPLYQRQDGRYILHRVISRDAPYVCMGDNQFTPEEGLQHSQMIALVTAFYRGSRRCSVNAWHYRLYCRLWHYTRPLRRFWRRGIGWLKRHLKK